jgi:hypothetical protein
VKDTLTYPESCLVYKYNWESSTYFTCGNMIVQESTVLSWCSITGTRPGVILSNNNGPDTTKGTNWNGTFVSDIPQHVSVGSMPNTVCWEDIELFFLEDPEASRDVPCAIINFRNLKGRPEGADG